MIYDEAINYLYGLQKYGIKLGLGNTRRLLSLLGNPQNSFRSVHIAGTNGKGSTCAMIAAVLKTAGFRVGLFTSPHLVSFTERIRVNDAEVEEKEVVELTKEIREVIESNQRSVISSEDVTSNIEPRTSNLNPTFFEFATAMGFLYFKRRGVEWAVVETGMGGRLDATNVLAPAVTVITNISCDHREFLGDTLREIAGEKAGIIKKGIPVVCASQEPRAMEVISRTAAEKGSALSVYGRDFVSRPGKMDLHGIVFSYEGKERLEDLYVPLCGTHQVENASVAVKTLEFLGEKESVPPHVVREGLARTKWQGRLELIRNSERRCDFLIDGAHNPAASRALADSLERYFVPAYQRTILILGIMADKDREGIMEPLLPLASEVIFTAPDYERAAPPRKLAEYAEKLGLRSKVSDSVQTSLELARGMASESSGKTLVVVTGSFYTIGEAKICLGGKCHSPSLSRLR